MLVGHIDTDPSCPRFGFLVPLSATSLNPLNVFKHGHQPGQERHIVSILDEHIHRLSLIIHPSLYLDRAALRFNFAPFR